HPPGKGAAGPAPAAVNAGKTALAAFDELNRLPAPAFEAPPEANGSKDGGKAEKPDLRPVTQAARTVAAALEILSNAAEALSGAAGTLAAAMRRGAEALAAIPVSADKTAARFEALAARLAGALAHGADALARGAAAAGALRAALERPPAPAQAGSSVQITVAARMPAPPASEGGALERLIEFARANLQKALDAVSSALSRLWAALAPFSQTVGAGLEWLYKNVLAPLGGFVINELPPRFLNALAAALGVLDAVITAVKPALLYIFEQFLKPVAKWTCDAALAALDALGRAFGTASALVSAASGVIGGALAAVTDGLSGVASFVSGAFAAQWVKAWEGVKSSFSGVWNGMVSMMYGAVNLIIRGVNGMITALNRVSFSVPSWVPGIGGGSFGFKLPRLSEIPVPRLARGAVIPANREFLAVLGDQRAGRNLEAPEALLRDIVREEGGASSRVEDLLERLIELTARGSVLAVNETVLGRVTWDAHNAEMRRLGYTTMSV
ncbi:MAG: hypothetical protein FWH06_02490, partial [Oscillospiraceae bacterium]|nr:hypothetical protein [Oscillospiraceae bacterium]